MIDWMQKILGFHGKREGTRIQDKSLHYPSLEGER